MKRPEAIESVFIMYRITGNKTLQDKAWNMFQAVNKYTRTDIAVCTDANFLTIQN